MTHDEALELLELAAAEPNGFERLAAGDRPEAAALAGHLAGCERCRAEHDALRRLAGVLRTILPELPADDLRERTLATVAALGRPRSAGGAEESSTTESRPTPHLVEVPPPPAGRRVAVERRRFLRAAGVAAALVVALGIGLYAGGQSREAEVGRQAMRVAALERLAVTSLAVAAAPDAESAALVAADGGAEGRVLYSPTTGQLVVVARGLEPPPAGWEYRCWVEVEGERTVVGRMVFADALAYWAGPADVLTGAAAPSRFGISLVAVGETAPGEPVLEGRP